MSRKAHKKSALTEFFGRYISDDAAYNASALTYYLLFSLFPMLIFVSALLGYFDLPFIDADNIAGNIIPPDVRELINAYIGYVSEMKNPYLLLTGLVLAVYSVTLAMNCLNMAVNRAYRIKPERAGLRLYLKLVILTVFFITALVSSLIALSLGRNLLRLVFGMFGLDPDALGFWNVLRVILSGLVLLVMLSVIYFFTPQAAHRLRDTLPGTFIAFALWVIFSAAFAFYVEKFGRYATLYGSIGTLMVLLIWLRYCSLALIMGAEYNGILHMRRRVAHGEGERKLPAVKNNKNKK